MISTRQSYDQDLATLREDLLHMGVVVTNAIDKAVESLAKRNVSLAKQIMDGDDVIDDMQVDIEDKCMVLIARQQPMARDLRIIGTGLKITTDLERVGDHAFDIAKIAVDLNGKELIKPLVDIPRMAKMSQTMLKDALEAYINLDIVLAEQVCAADDEVDQLNQQLFRELLTYMMEDHRTISQATQLILVARSLERVADHATNIAEWVIYLVTGQRMRKK
ncbi:Phosphate-specific transport system accessory protein PhoU [bioreactor metagenome]|uniref:Phosphate-specific transport system accessory protein PhoU n=1 Tax=bioreactor metagenome TaxID=1076179 RepID=A0A644UDY5_9ZZZZ|nr:phosphate signaling complex protein PhoU [Negativicutes bacterium]